jgi:hypothetical protein
MDEIGFEFTTSELQVIALNCLLLKHPAKHSAEALAGLLDYATTKNFIKVFRPLLDLRAPDLLAGLIGARPGSPKAMPRNS